MRACEQSAAGALVITGQGKMFSAGVDLPRLVEGGAAYVREFLPAMNHAFETLFAFPKPLVVAVNGHAIAGGCVMACCADYRIMAREPGRIGIPELLVGVPFPVVPLEIVRFATPPQHLQALIYRGLTPRRTRRCVRPGRRRRRCRSGWSTKPSPSPRASPRCRIRRFI